MKRLFAVVYFLLAGLFLVGCAAAGRTPLSADEPLGDLPASFVGELPCADCAGIRYRLNLFADQVYSLSTVYLGRGEERRFSEQGRWSLDDGGDTLRLQGDDEGDGSGQGARMWRVRDARTLEMLDVEGREIDSPLDYTLARTEQLVSESLENTYWKLVRLNGEPVEVQDNRREPHLVLHAEGTRVAGATGCNRLMGSYRLAGERLTFGQLASTRMACLDGMQTEQAFLAALEKTANWRVLGEHLALYDARGARLARFEVRHLY